MITGAHKDLLTALARQHAKEVRHALQLARASFNLGHPTIERLTSDLELADQTVGELEAESARRVA